MNGIFSVYGPRHECLALRRLTESAVFPGFATDANVTDVIRRTSRPPCSVGVVPHITAVACLPALSRDEIETDPGTGPEARLKVQVTRVNAI